MGKDVRSCFYMTDYHGPPSGVSWSCVSGEELGPELVKTSHILNCEFYQASELLL